MLDLEYLLELAQSHAEALKAPVASFELRGRHFDAGSGPQIMGVVNLSPDSWYRESVCLSAEQAIERGCRLKTEGAVLVDVGAESTLPQAERVDSGQQRGMLLPVVGELAKSGCLVSVETYDAGVAASVLEAGAAVLNLTGLKDGESLYRLAAEHEAGIILCYVQGADVRSVGDFALGADHSGVLHDYFAREIEKATAAGVRRIWIDPGMGFYYRNLQDSRERVRYQMRTFLESFRLRKLGWPVCHALPHAFEYFREEVRTAESFFAVLALLGKTDLLRTHEVPKIKAVIETMKAFDGK